MPRRRSSRLSPGRGLTVRARGEHRISGSADRSEIGADLWVRSADPVFASRSCVRMRRQLPVIDDAASGLDWKVLQSAWSGVNWTRADAAASKHSNTISVPLTDAVGYTFATAQMWVGVLKRNDRLVRVTETTNRALSATRPTTHQTPYKRAACIASPSPHPVRVRVRPGLSLGALHLRGERDELDIEDQRGIGGDDAARTW